MPNLQAPRRARSGQRTAVDERYYRPEARRKSGNFDIVEWHKIKTAGQSWLAGGPMKRSLTSSLLLAAVLAAPPPATHVVAVSGEVILTTALDTPSQINAPDVTAGAVGEFVVAWSADYTIYGGSQPIGFMGGIHGRKVGLHAQPLGPGLDIVPFGNALDVENPRIA